MHPSGPGLRLHSRSKLDRMKPFPEQRSCDKQQPNVAQYSNQHHNGHTTKRLQPHQRNNNVRVEHGIANHLAHSNKPSNRWRVQA
ncbi:hypothetical protein AgCh_032053 [Apium graveolens]